MQQRLAEAAALYNAWPTDRQQFSVLQVHKESSIVYALITELWLRIKNVFCRWDKNLLSATNYGIWCLKPP